MMNEFIFDSIYSLEQHLLNGGTPTDIDIKGNYFLDVFFQFSTVTSSKNLFLQIITYPVEPIQGLASEKHQQNLMKSWWKTLPNIPGMIANNEIPSEMGLHFFKHLNIDKHVSIQEHVFVNNMENNAKYLGGAISWLHFAISENWTLAFTMCPELSEEQMTSFVNLNTSLNETVWHSIASAMSYTDRSNYFSLMELLLPYWNGDLMHKDNFGNTVFDVLTNNMEKFKNNGLNEKDNSKKEAILRMADFNQKYFNQLENLHLYHQLNRMKINADPQKKNKI